MSVSGTGLIGTDREPMADLTQNHFDYRRHIECTICEEQIDYRAMNRRVRYIINHLS